MPACPEAFVDLLPPRAGQRLADRFRIVEFVGKGGMSLVYRCTDEQEGDQAALKVLRPELSTWERVRMRLAAEAVTMTILRHPHIARVRDMGTDPGSGLSYIVMDWAPGGSAAEQNKRSGPLPVSTVARWGVELACALAAAHDRGIVHRDVKPANILLGANGEALLADFGVAYVPDADAETDVDAVLGSVAYMSPEQRLSPHHVDARADVYALGATLFQLATRRNPVDLFASDADDPRWNALPDALRPVVFHATRHRPEDRPADMRALAAELSPLVPPDLWCAEPWLADWLGACA